MNVGQLVSIDGVVIHNDAGSGSPEWYVNWLRTRLKSLGIAHYYINRYFIARVIDTNLIAHHTGEWNSNCRYIGYEICQSMSATDEEFLLNEDITLMQALEDLIYYGLPINENTVRLHHEFVPTACPHRSLSLHGGTTQSVKSYFINRMLYFKKYGNTVDEILNNLGMETPRQKINKIKGEFNTMLMVRSHSGKQGYVGLVNGQAFGIGHIETVHQFLKVGAEEINIHDDDFDRLIKNHQIDDETLKSVNEITKTISNQHGQKVK